MDEKSMDKYDTLYRRSKTGTILYWGISVDLLTYPTIYKESGQLGTPSPVQHKEEIRMGKNIGKINETTPMEQALSDAQSDWTRKHDEGYKSLADLRIKRDVNLLTQYYVDGATTDQRGSFEHVLNSVLPTFNTDASGNVKPMLATDWKKVKNITYPCYIQPKLDGVRCLMVSTINGNGSPSTVFLSRQGKEFTTLNHIRTEVDAYQYSYMPGNFTLDGEIYSDELTFQEITQAVKKQYPNSLKLKFQAYDVVSESQQYERLAEMLRIVKAINSPHVTAVDTEITQHADGVKELHDKWVLEGNEGAMLRLYEGTYAQGQRSRHLLKVKEFNSDEFKFMVWEFGKRAEDLIAVCSSPKGEFRAKMIGSKVQKEELYTKHKNHTGNLIVKYFGLTDDGIPRFPIGVGFRDYE